MAAPAVMEVLNHVAQKSEEELRLEYDWFVKIYVRNSQSTGTDYMTRCTGQYAEALVIFIMTGTLIQPKSKVYHGDIVPCMNIYRIAPPHVQEIIAPLIALWKEEANKAPDTCKYAPLG